MLNKIGTQLSSDLSDLSEIPDLSENVGHKFVALKRFAYFHAHYERFSKAKGQLSQAACL